MDHLTLACLASAEVPEEARARQSPSAAKLKNMSHEPEPNQTSAALLDAILKQLERIADSLQTIAAVAQSDRKQDRQPFSISTSSDLK
jgi:hypothetical protein